MTTNSEKIAKIRAQAAINRAANMAKKNQTTTTPKATTTPATPKATTPKAVSTVTATPKTIAQPASTNKVSTPTNAVNVSSSYYDPNAKQHATIYNPTTGDFKQLYANQRDLDEHTLKGYTSYTGDAGALFNDAYKGNTNTAEHKQSLMGQPIQQQQIDEANARLNQYNQYLDYSKPTSAPVMLQGSTSEEIDRRFEAPTNPFTIDQPIIQQAIQNQVPQAPPVPPSAYGEYLKQQGVGNTAPTAETPNLGHIYAPGESSNNQGYTQKQLVTNDLFNRYLRQIYQGGF